MAIRFPKAILLRSNQASSVSLDVTKGNLSVYAGENEKKRLIIPVLLCQAEEEFGFDHPMGGLTFPCEQDIFLDITSRLS